MFKSLIRTFAIVAASIAGHRDGDEGGAQDLEGATETGELCGARDVLGEQGADGHSGGQADSAEHLGAGEGTHHPLLDGVVRGRRGHSGKYARYPVVARGRGRVRPRSSGEEHFSPKEGVGSSNLPGGTHETRSEQRVFAFHAPHGGGTGGHKLPLVWHTSGTDLARIWHAEGPAADRGGWAMAGRSGFPFAESGDRNGV